MLVVGIHAHVFHAQTEFVNGLGDRVGKRQGPVARAAHRLARVALAPTAAIAGLQRNTVRVQGDAFHGPLDDQSPQTGIANAELRAFALAVH